MLGLKLSNDINHLMTATHNSCLEISDKNAISFRQKLLKLLSCIKLFDVKQLSCLSDFAQSLSVHYSPKELSLDYRIFGTKAQNQRLLDIIELIYETEADDIDIDEIAKEFKVCKKTLNRDARKLNLTFYKMIKKINLFKVKEALRQACKPTIMDLIIISGENTDKSLERAFKKETGLSLWQYRDKYL